MDVGGFGGGATGRDRSNASAQTAACINNLKQIDGAKQQWALENRKTETDVPTEADILKYLPAKPVCPSGGTYTINAVGTPAACSVPEHSLLP